MKTERNLPRLAAAVGAVLLLTIGTVLLLTLGACSRQKVGAQELRPVLEELLPKAAE